jgi:hypothetical protein
MDRWIFCWRASSRGSNVPAFLDLGISCGLGLIFVLIFPRTIGPFVYIFSDSRGQETIITSLSIDPWAWHSVLCITRISFRLSSSIIHQSLVAQYELVILMRYLSRQSHFNHRRYLEELWTDTPSLEPMENMVRVIHFTECTWTERRLTRLELES